MARNPRVSEESKALKRIRRMNNPPPMPKGLHDKVLADFRKETKRLKSDASSTPGEKALPRGGGRAKAAATRAGNIAKSKARGTHVGGKGVMSAQDKRNRARARSDARTRVGGGSPGSRVAGGLARFKGR